MYTVYKNTVLEYKNCFTKIQTMHWTGFTNRQKTIFFSPQKNISITLFPHAILS